MRLLAPTMAALLAAGCVTSSGRQAPAPLPAAKSSGVLFDDISAQDGPGTNRLVLAPNESFLTALSEPDNPLPAYPAPLLAQDLPQRVVCVEVAVGTDGRVGVVRQKRELEPCPDLVEPGFVNAVVQVVRLWKFEPALRCVFPDVETRERSYSSCSGGKEVPQPITLTYRFVFEQANGRPQVRVGG